jgi:hypothetical protein
LYKTGKTVFREELFYLIWKYGVEKKVWRLLKELHSTVSNKVVLGDLESEWFINV